MNPQQIGHKEAQKHKIVWRHLCFFVARPIAHLTPAMLRRMR